MATQSVALLVAGGPRVESAEFSEWVRPHLLAMTRLATRLAGDAADDVVQEALVRAWRRHALGCADGTVKSQLSEARARLRRELGEA